MHGENVVYVLYNTYYTYYTYKYNTIVDKFPYNVHSEKEGELRYSLANILALFSVTIYIWNLAPQIL